MYFLLFFVAVKFTAVLELNLIHSDRVGAFKDRQKIPLRANFYLLEVLYFVGYLRTSLMTSFFFKSFSWKAIQLIWLVFTLQNVLPVQHCVPISLQTYAVHVKCQVTGLYKKCLICCISFDFSCLLISNIRHSSYLRLIWGVCVTQAAAEVLWSRASVDQMTGRDPPHRFLTVCPLAH